MVPDVVSREGDALARDQRLPEPRMQKLTSVALMPERCSLLARLENG